MLTVAANRFVPAALALLFALTLAAPAPARRQATPADTLISNRAESTYRDEEGNEYGTVSPTVTVTVRAVSAHAVTPDETEPSAAVAANERAARLFRVCNNGNTPDLYTLTRAEVSASGEPETRRCASESSSVGNLRKIELARTAAYWQ